MRLADDAYHHRALFQRFLGIFDLKDSALRRAIRMISRIINLQKQRLQGDRIVVVVISEHSEGALNVGEGGCARTLQDCHKQ